MRVQGEVRVTWNREVVYGEGVKRLSRFELVRDCARRTQLGKAVGDEQDEDDEQTVRRAFNLEVTEE